MIPGLLSIVFGAALTGATCLALGVILLRVLRTDLYRQEQWPLAFVCGAAVLSAAVFYLCCLHAIGKYVLIAVSLASLAAWWKLPKTNRLGLPPLPPYLRVLFTAGFATYGLLYVRYALAPEMSPDGMAYHLGFVNRFTNAGGFVRITTNLYAALSQGMEMLFLFAFAFGKHSAAATVHYLFLLCLPLLMLTYSRRFKMPAAGVFGALFVFASPVVGLDGTIAYNDVALACVLFGAFYAMQIWETEPREGVLVLAGILSGFAFAIKYTGISMLLAAVLFVVWKRRARSIRPLLLLAAGAAPLMLPWPIKNWIWLSNPFAPFANAIFPNPYIHISFEREWANHVGHMGNLNLWQIPLEVTIRGGKLGGFVGPAFLAAPLALLALRTRQGRSLLFAAIIMGIPYLLAIGARFLIPVLPFIALCLGIALSGVPVLLYVFLITHMVSSWPTVAKKYCAPDAWRFRHVSWNAALRIESEDDYLRRWSSDYGIARMIEARVPAAEKVFAFSGIAEAYTSRDVLIGYQAAFNENIKDILYAGFLPEYQPLLALRFTFPQTDLRRLRIRQLATGKVDIWSMNEIHIVSASRDLPFYRTWQVRASPYPWDAALAVDRSPVTRWRTWQAIRPGMYYEIDMQRTYPVHAVRIEFSGPQWESRLALEGSKDNGNWLALSSNPVIETVPARDDLRKLAAAETAKRDVRYLLVKDTDPGAADFDQHRSEWGIALVDSGYEARLYRIESALQ